MPDHLDILIRDESRLDERAGYMLEVIAKALQAGPVTVRLSRPTRSLDQNAKMWAMLADISSQVEWHGVRLSPTDWKNLVTASIFGIKMLPGLDGGFVALGKATSRMTKRQLSDVIEQLYAFGAEHDVTWSGPDEKSHP